VRRPTLGHRGGFTLAEVLLTLLIMGGIMVSVTQILHAARVSRDTIHYVQETELAGPAILDLVERDLRAVFTFDRPRQAQFRVVNRVMLGLDGDSLDFVTATDSLLLHLHRDQPVVSDVNEVGYRLRPNPLNDDFLEIYRRESPGVDDKPFEGGRFAFLHDRVKVFDVLVFAEDGPDAEPLEDWGQSSDQERQGLPARVEITLVLELAARLPREQLRIVSLDRRTVTYKRIIRLPESLRRSEAELPVAVVPQGPSAPEQAGGAGGSGGPQGAGGAAGLPDGANPLLPGSPGAGRGGGRDAGSFLNQ
jgi:type II secretory pathway component PulJ